MSVVRAAGRSGSAKIYAMGPGVLSVFQCGEVDANWQGWVVGRVGRDEDSLKRHIGFGCRNTTGRGRGFRGGGSDRRRSR